MSVHVSKGPALGPIQTSYLVITWAVTLMVKGLGYESGQCSAKVQSYLSSYLQSSICLHDVPRDNLVLNKGLNFVIPMYIP